MAALLVLLTAGGLRAEARVSGGEELQDDVSLSSPVQSGSKTTYFDLLRELFPDLQRDSTAHKTIALRSLSEPRKREVIEGDDIKFEFKPYWFNSGGRRLLLLWVSVKAESANEWTPYEGEADVMAVFTMEPRARMLDALEVKTDRFTGFWEDKSVFHLDSRNDAFIVYSTHWNAGESYMNVEMLFVDGGRLKTITSLFLYETQGCGSNYTEKPEFRAVAGSGGKYPNVLVRVKLTKGPDEEGCERRSRSFTRYYQGLYRWNQSKGRYESNSAQLDQFDKFNEKRVSSP
ncbi:MAG TPA: hypothetical protein VFA21_16765 [Pyrinomonadaceae bacterium]|nr:hypothetical protein [Pyrinomonadaceae bacterium]